MARLIIENIGPIKKVDFDLNKINVFMGPQSSGKSTISKIISFCSWLDKRFSKEGLSKREPKSDYIQELKRYHRLTNGYFNEDSKIYFLGEFIELDYNNCQPMSLTDNVFGFDHWASNKEKYRCKIGMKGSFPTGKNSKVAYIPAERNFVSAIYNLQEYLRDNDNIQDFVNTWYEIKRKYSSNNKLNILNLGAEYYSEGDHFTDKLYLKEGGDILLQIASSGLQAVVPLIIMFDYVTKGLYNEKRPLMSAKELSDLQGKINELIEKGEKEQNVDYSQLLDILSSKKYHYSQIIIEEPEQNLFPSTQRDLIYHFLNTLNSVEQDHRLTFTTHSPYILYALNNCMMGYLVNKQLQEDEQADYLSNNFLSAASWIDPKLVSVWEVEDGGLRNIQDKDNIISGNYFDQKMTELVDEYYQILNYYKNEE